jgi:monothiol glutaredoxin
MGLDPASKQRIDALISRHPVTLFMKGNRDEPRCGFSATVVRILDALIPDYQTFDVLEDQSLREDIKAYSSWPTIPQLYVDGEFVGGCDIIQELESSGELGRKLGVETGEAGTPEIVVTDEAAEGLRRATGERPPDHVLHLSIDARFFGSLSVGPRYEGGIEIEAGGLPWLMDPHTARRAQGVRIDVVDTPQGLAFKIDNPNAPNRVEQMGVADLKRRLDAGEAFELLDVRTPEERAMASIPGAVLLTQESAARLEGMPRDTMLVFHCHHGGRSQQAAEHFASLGFTNVWNVEGGIDAWSREIDPDVPRY